MSSLADWRCPHCRRVFVRLERDTPNGDHYIALEAQVNVHLDTHMLCSEIANLSDAVDDLARHLTREEPK